MYVCMYVCVCVCMYVNEILTYHIAVCYLLLYTLYLLVNFQKNTMESYLNNSLCNINTILQNAGWHSRIT